MVRWHELGRCCDVGDLEGCLLAVMMNGLSRPVKRYLRVGTSRMNEAVFWEDTGTQARVEDWQDAQDCLFANDGHISGVR